jgi:hypothetical protein
MQYVLSNSQCGPLKRSHRHRPNRHGGKECHKKAVPASGRMKRPARRQVEPHGGVEVWPSIQQTCCWRQTIPLGHLRYIRSCEALCLHGDAVVDVATYSAPSDLRVRRRRVRRARFSSENPTTLVRPNPVSLLERYQGRGVRCSGVTRLVDRESSSSRC